MSEFKSLNDPQKPEAGATCGPDGCRIAEHQKNHEAKS